MASLEAKKYGTVNLACNTEDRNHAYVPSQNSLKINNAASYFHYCANNTVYGTAWKYIPDTGRVPLVADMSSNILSEPLDVTKFNLIYAGAQKNIAPAGLTVVIVRDDLPIKPLSTTPTILDYGKMIENDSMTNTPPTFNIYVLGLVLDWIDKQGGLANLAEYNKEKADMIYSFLDNSSFYQTHAEPEARSLMNVTFRTQSDTLDATFVQDAEKEGLINIKGHRVIGGLRASIFNAMPIEGVANLIDFMGKFERRNR